MQSKSVTVQEHSSLANTPYRNQQRLKSCEEPSDREHYEMPWTEMETAGQTVLMKLKPLPSSLFPLISPRLESFTILHHHPIECASNFILCLNKQKCRN